MSLSFVGSVRSCTKRAAMVAVALGAVFASGGAWALPLRQCEMTVGGYAGSSTLANFPLLVRISPTVINGFLYDQCAAGGADISFTLEDGTVLPHEVDTWNTEGESLVWVKIPSLSGKTTKFKFRWNDPLPDANDPTLVWSEYAGVWHLGETDASTNSNAVDATGHGFTAWVPVNATTGESGIAKEAKIGLGRWKPKTAMTVPNYDSQNVGGTFTASGWYYLDERTTYESFFARKKAWNEGTGWQFSLQNDDKLAFCTGSDGAKTYNPNLSSSVKQRWAYLVTVYNGTNLKIYDNTTKVFDNTIAAAGDNGLKLTVGGNVRGTIDEVRIRKAASSADWVKAEYDQVTAAGFVTAGTPEILSTSVISVCSSSEQYGAVSPDYGIILEPVVGQEYVFACTQPEQILVADQKRAVCTGWRLFKLSDGSLVKSSADAGETAYTCRHTYVKDEGVKLEWLWQVEYKAKARVRGNGSVDKTEAWVAAGVSVTFAATAGDAAKFLAWTGDRSSFVPTATFADVQSSFAVTAEFADADWQVRYVAPADVDGDGSAASPYTNVNVAVASLATLGTATGAVVIAEGDYKLTETLTLTNAIRVIGMGMDKTKLKGTLLKGVNGGRNGSRGAYVDHKAAWMGGLTVTDCSTKYVNGCGVYLKRGTLDGVRSYANRSGLGEYIRPNNGVGLYMEGGLATNCVIESNVGEGGYGDRYGTGLTISSGTFTDGQVLNNVCNRNQSSGLGVYVSGSGAIVRNSLIQGNNAGSYQPGDYTYGMGVFMNQNGLVENCRIIGNSVQGVYMTSGTLRNCLVTGHKNSSTSYASGIDVRGGGKVVNCTVWGNTSANKFAGLYCDNSSALIVNNIVYGNGTDGDLKVTAGTCHTNLVGSVQLISTSKAVGNVASDPLFKDPSAGDFTFDNKSPASDKAAPRTDVTRDLVGVERPQNAGPDIGCFECLYEIKGLEVTVAVPRTDWNVGEAVTAEATVFGATGEVTYEWSVDDVVYAGQEGATATFTGLSSGRHTVSVKVSDGTQEASGSVSEPIAVKPTVVYVDDAKGNDAENYPYDDATKPAKTVNAAFDALGRTGSNTTTMHIAAGTYTLTKEVTLDTTVNVLGAGMDVTVLSGASLPSTARCLSLTKAGSRVVGLTLRDCKTLVSGAGLYMSANGWVEDVALRNNEIGMGGGSTPSSGVGLYQTDGTVTNCVISGNSQNSSYGTGSGVGVYITGGTLVDSVVTNNWRNRSQLCGAGVNASGTAKVLRCKIVGNSNKQGEWDSPTYGMGLCLSGGTVADCEIVNNGRQGVYASGGTIKNCLIAGSKTAPSGWAGGLQLLGATVINCTVGGNVSSTAAQGDLLMTSGKFQNSIAQYAVVTGGTLTHSLTNANPRFRNPARGDYRVFRSSPAVNTGDWTLFGKMKEGVKAATDLNGAPRLIADEIDMGCYENPFDGLLLLVK